MDTHSQQISGQQAVSDLIVSCLEAEGVEFVFGIPGEENIWLVRSLQRSSKIRYVLVRHEAAASFMAGIYGRLTGRAAEGGRLRGRRRRAVHPWASAIRRRFLWACPSASRTRW